MLCSTWAVSLATNSASWRSLSLHSEVFAVSWQGLSAGKEKQELAIQFIMQVGKEAARAALHRAPHRSWGAFSAFLEHWCAGL